MTKDSILWRELKSLKEELSAARQTRSVSPAEHNSASSEAVSPTSTSEDTAERQRLHGDLHEFLDEITKFIEDAEKNALAHSTTSVIGAMIVGILIGRFLGRH